MPKTEKPEGKVKTPKRKKNKKSDLLRQRKLASLISENRGRKTIGELMKLAGYSDSYAKNPQQMKETLSWQELMEKNLPDDLLSKKHNELLNATGIGHMIFPVKTTDQEITELLATVNCTPQKFQHGDTAIHVWYWARDNKAIKEALDMAYKLKAKYPKELAPVNINTIQLTDEQLTRIFKG
jgi:hypothetical protein